MENMFKVNSKDTRTLSRQMLRQYNMANFVLFLTNQIGITSCVSNNNSNNNNNNNNNNNDNNNNNNNSNNNNNNRKKSIFCVTCSEEKGYFKTKTAN